MLIVAPFHRTWDSVLCNLPLCQWCSQGSFSFVKTKSNTYFINVSRSHLHSISYCLFSVCQTVVLNTPHTCCIENDVLVGVVLLLSQTHSCWLDNNRKQKCITFGVTYFLKAAQNSKVSFAYCAYCTLLTNKEGSNLYWLWSAKYKVYFRN